MDYGDARKGLENIRVRKAYDPDTRYPGEDVAEGIEEHSNDPLMSPQAAAMLRKIREWWEQARQNQAENREQQAIDEDYYDGLQWADEDIIELLERHQAPYVFNLIKPACDWIIGTEKRTRMDFKIHARKDDKEVRDNAQVKTDTLKYLDDVNLAAYARSQAFAQTVKVGVGWLEDGVRNDESDELIFSRQESWRNIWYDHLSVERDLGDARFLFRAKWTDLDYAEKMFPGQEWKLREAAQAQVLIAGDEESDDFWYARMLSDADSNRVVRRSWVDEQGSAINRRERVRLVECWYRVPARVKRMRGFDSNLDGEVYDEKNPEHIKAAEEEIVSLRDALVMEMWCAIFSGSHLLQNIKSPYKHNDFPFTPIWAYRRGRDNAPYGAIRNSRDPQEDMNKRASKSLFILSTNQVFAEQGAVEEKDWDEFVDQASRPDGAYNKLRPGALANNKIEIRRDTELAEEHLMLMDRDQAMIRNTSGVQGENMGADTNAISGKAILAKQNEGSVVTFELFDNYRYALQLQGRKRLSLIEQYMDMPKTIRVVGDRGKVQYVPINDPEWDPIEGKFTFKNDMTRHQADFVIDQQDFRATIRQAMFEQLMDMMSKLDSQIALNLLDIVITMSDLPEKDELVARIRRINGQSDPDEEEMPEQAAERQARERAQKEERDLEIRRIVAEVVEKEAKAEKTRVESQKAAIEAGTALVSAPVVAGPTDQILESAGFQDADGQGLVAPAVPAPAAQPQPGDEVINNGIG